LKETPWRVELTPAVEQAFQRIRIEEPNGNEAIDGLLLFLSRSPRAGFAVPRSSGARSRPFHTGVASYLAVYVIKKDVVTCVGIRRVPSGPF
jgi:hypothetical protein